VLLCEAVLGHKLLHPVLDGEFREETEGASMRFDLVQYLFRFIGSRYQWGGEGPYNVGFDCSGFVLEGLKAFGLWGKNDATSQGIYEHFLKAKGASSSRPDVGCLLFFGKDTKSITHIGVSINNYQFIEAGGGDSKSVDKGMVRIRPNNWRKDLVAVIDIFDS
jgi:cell wall-associated NlpC family hydrolase